MIFNTLSYYFVFLLPAAIAFRLLPATARVWSLALWGAAFFIYYSVTTPIGGWAGAACVVILLWEALFSRLYRKKSGICVVGVLLTLGVLFAFKYWNFTTDLATRAWTSNPVSWEGVFLPIGISFFTFEFIHYAVDRYRGLVRPGRNREYLAFIFFFPTMVAGPIKRYQDFLPALRSPSTDWQFDFNRGITRILVGLVKKLGVADLMTALTVHLNPADINHAHRWALPVWLLAYGLQIYFDFSGYSDIAIGSARLFGIGVPENFDWPYLQTNINQFWRHWHMSLYRWLVDYVFIPLGGSRVREAKIYRNVLITMLVSGLWHGAALNFLLWGAWHGGMLCVHRLWSKWNPLPKTRLTTLAAWAATFVGVQLGWAFFAMNLPTAGLFFKRLFVG